jgi:propionyl-CoA carboxylase alpha chain
VSYVDSVEGSVDLTELPRFNAASSDAAEGTLTAPLPGAVARVLVVPGVHVVPRVLFVPGVLCA